MFNRRRPRDWQHHRRTMKQPGQRHLVNTNAMLLRGGLKAAAGVQTSAARYRRPRHKPKLFLLAVGKRVVPLSIINVVSVLYGYDWQHRTRLFDLLRRYF